MSKKRRGRIKGDPVTYQLPTPAGGVQLETFAPWTLVKRGIKMQIITPLDAPQEFMEEACRERHTRESEQDTALLRALGLAYHWQRLLNEKRVGLAAEIAEAEVCTMAVEQEEASWTSPKFYSSNYKICRNF